jgi:DNA-binding NtrC family response regulator
VRELRNVVERACILADGELITERELSPGKPPKNKPAPVAAISGGADDPAERQAESGELASLERDHILRVMESVGGNKMSAARILGIGRRALYRRLERYGIGTIERRQRSKT